MVNPQAVFVYLNVTVWTNIIRPRNSHGFIGTQPRTPNSIWKTPVRHDIIDV